MLPESTVYPRFVSNQLLTEKSLNEMVGYFDNQVRDTRIFLIGLGIYYGLELSIEVNPNPTLVVNKGIGVSSQGFLFKLENDCRLTHYTSVEVPRINLRGELCGDSFPGNYTVLKLSETETLNSPLTLDDLDNKVVVILCEEEDDSVSVGNRCINELDERGISIKTSVSILLMNKDDVEDFANIQEDSTGNSETLESINLRRFGFRSSSQNKYGFEICLNDIRTTSEFINGYTNVFNADNTTIIKKIADAYKNAGDKFFQLFNEDQSIFANLENQLISFENKIMTSIPSVRNGIGRLLNIQYYYDYLKDLILAYEAFACLEVIQRTGLFPDKCSFPKYLLLGDLVSTSDGVEVYGEGNKYLTLLQRPPTEDIGSSGIDEARLNFERMKKLVQTSQGGVMDNVYLPFENNNENIIITPSKGRNLPLSDRAIPFYLNYQNFKDCWNSELNSLGKREQIPSYYYFNSYPKDVHLFYDLDKYEFFRVEGHIGRDLDSALTEIRTERKQLNVPFDIQCVKLEYLDDSEETGKYSGKFDDLERLYTKVRGDIICLIDNSNTPEITIPNTSGLLATLPETLENFNYSNFESNYNNVFTSPDVTVKDCNLPVLEDLAIAYKTRKDELLSLIWFHNFAEKHPGMEHMGGVYKGGTLVLVYIENSPAGFPMVIADFCLPYSCCSNAPTVVYHVSRIQPRIIMEDVFCSNDDTEKDIVLTPADGLLEVNGVDVDSDTYKFIPSSFSPVFDTDGKAEIIVKYEVSGVSVSKTITIEKAPDFDIDTIEEKIFQVTDSGLCLLTSVKFTISDNLNEAESGSYTWKFDGNVISEEDSFEHVFDIGQSGKLEVMARKGDCINADSIDINTCPLQTDLFLDFVNTATIIGGIHSISVEEEFVELLFEPIGGQFILKDSDGVPVEPLVIVPVEPSVTNCLDKKFQINLFESGEGNEGLTQGQVYTLEYFFTPCDGVKTEIKFIIGEFDMVGSSSSKATSKKKVTTSTSKKKPAPAKKKSKPSKTPEAKKTVKTKASTLKPAPKKLQNGAKVMNQRRVAQQSILKELEEGNRLKGKSFGLGMNFFLTPGNDAQVLNKKFEETMKAVLISVKRSKDDKKKDWMKMGEVMLYNFLDKHVTLNPSSIDDVTIELLKTQVGKMKELKFNLKTLHKNWKGKDLETALKATVVKEINKLF